MATERYPGKRSEYGGGDGTPQRLPDGSSLEAGEGVFTVGGTKGVQRSARLMRQAGKADYDPARSDAVGAAATALDINSMTDAQREAYDKDLEISKRRQAQRARLRDASNGYIDEPETYTGGGVS